MEDWFCVGCRRASFLEKGTRIEDVEEKRVTCVKCIEKEERENEDEAREEMDDAISSTKEEAYAYGRADGILACLHALEKL